MTMVEPPIPTTNILAMPLVELSISTGTNEDWIDSIKYMVEDGSSPLPQLDLRGITFEMEIRRAAPDHEVVINASTEDGSICIGQPPNFGFLIINVDLSEMKLQQPGKYVGDIIGYEMEKDHAGTILHHLQRVVAYISLTIVEGVTR